MTTHKLNARMSGSTIQVFNEKGEQVKVSFAGTSDNRTLYAYVDGLGFIGGWQYPHRKMSWKALADSINQGRLYEALDDLPTGRARRSKAERDQIWRRS